MLVGTSASGKSWWSHSHFAATQVVSSDRCRALVSDDEANQDVNRQAFAVFYEILRQRLSLRRLTVADSTALQAFARQKLLRIAEAYGVPACAVVFDAPLPLLLERNRRRDRQVPEEVLLRQRRDLDAVLESGTLHTEGFAAVHLLRLGGEAQPLEEV